MRCLFCLLPLSPHAREEGKFVVTLGKKTSKLSYSRARLFMILSILLGPIILTKENNYARTASNIFFFLLDTRNCYFLLVLVVYASPRCFPSLSIFHLPSFSFVFLRRTITARAPHTHTHTTTNFHVSIASWRYLCSARNYDRDFASTRHAACRGHVRGAC